MRQPDRHATINEPLTIYFAVPVETPSEGAPTVSKYDFDGGAFTTTGITIASLGVWDPSVNDSTRS